MTKYDLPSTLDRALQHLVSQGVLIEDDVVRFAAISDKPDWLKAYELLAMLDFELMEQPDTIDIVFMASFADLKEFITR